MVLVTGAAAAAGPTPAGISMPWESPGIVMPSTWPTGITAPSDAAAEAAALCPMTIGRACIAVNASSAKTAVTTPTATLRGFTPRAYACPARPQTHQRVTSLTL